MLPIRNIAEFEAWTNNVWASLNPFFALQALTSFAPTGLSKFLGVQFKNISVDEYRAILKSIESELPGADFSVLAPQLELFKLQMSVFTTDFELIEQLVQNDVSGLRAGIAEVRDLLKGQDADSKVEDALEIIFDGVPAGATEQADDLVGDGSDNVIDLLGGNDVYDGKGGNDTINGGDGLDILIGGAGRDKINGGAGLDRVIGDGGNDVLKGGAGTDVVIGGAGNDKMIGGGGGDAMRGETGRDNMKGGGGDDGMDGGSDNDRINGGKGNDRIEGGGGNDVLKGAGGKDVFVFNKDDDDDRIVDFQDDKDTLEINLDGPAPANIRQWLDANAEVINGDVVISAQGGSITLDGVGSIRLLVDDIDFI